MPSTHAWTRRHIKRTIWIVVFCVVAPLLISSVVLVYAFATKRWSIAQWLGLTGLFGFVGLLQLFWIIPVRRKVIAHKGRVCGNCLFALAGLDTEGICPECGEPFAIEDTIKGWERDFRMSLTQNAAADE